MRKAIIVLLLPLVVAIGCMEIDQKVTIHEDGTGILEMHYSADTSMINMMKARSQNMGGMGMGAQQGAKQQPSGGKSRTMGFEEEKIKEEYKDKENLTLKSVDSHIKDGKKYVDLTVGIKDIADFMKKDMFDKKVKFHRNEDGNYVLEAKAFGYGQEQGATASKAQEDSAGDSSKQPSQSKKQFQKKMMRSQKQMMDSMLKGFKYGLTIKTPSNIVKTSSHEKGDNSASWSYDYDKDSSFFQEGVDIYLEFEDSGVDINLDE